VNLRQAAQQALEALIPLANAACPNERECLTDEDHERAAEVLEALRAALAEPEQEPVAHIGNEGQVMWFKKPAYQSMLYTAPTPRKPLKDEEIDAVTVEQWGEMKGYPLAAHRAFARAIERAHGIGGEA
jgi:hypothetical protein